MYIWRTIFNFKNSLNCVTRFHHYNLFKKINLLKNNFDNFSVLKAIISWEDCDELWSMIHWLKRWGWDGRRIKLIGAEDEDGRKMKVRMNEDEDGRRMKLRRR